MNKRPVVFVALKDLDNLGIGYMAAMLSAEGFETMTINLYRGKSDILKILKNINPLLVGFSVIYQYYLDQFADLISYLRKNGITCHFTAGGHYASLKYEELFEFIPFLDSTVRFEGEYTLLELAKCLQNKSDWRNIKGLAYKEKGIIIANPLRSFEKDLDKFPFPVRSPLNEYAIGRKYTTIIAGRGCIYNCSYCNVKKFYSQPPGSIKRIRKPEMVVREMEFLYHKKKCSVFLFLDDDFPVNPIREPHWVTRFCDKLKESGLSEKVMWQICCRPDEVDEECFALMKENGMFLVFLGIEDGTNAGLKRLNKKMTVEKSLHGIAILKKLKIRFDFGFLLFQPLTTYKSLNENLDFLKQICGDGYAPITYFKMMPYYETRAEQELKTEGRLKILRGIRDYDFLDDSMNHYYNFVTDCFIEWLRDTNGIENISHWARNNFSVYSHYYNNYFHADFQKLNRKFTKIISDSNLFLLDTFKELTMFFESGQYKRDNNNLLETYRKRISFKHDSFRKRIHNTMDDLLLLADICR